MRDPTEGDRKTWQHSRAPANTILGLEINLGDDDNANPDDAEDDELDAADNAEEDLAFASGPAQATADSSATAMFLTQTEPAQRTPPQWLPHLPLTTQIYEHLSHAGPAGLSSMSLTTLATGMAWRRSTDEVMLRLTDLWQVSQPAHLKHLGIIRDTAVKEKIGHYWYRTAEHFATAVEEGGAAWEAVQTGTGKGKKKALDLDAWGFPKMAASRFAGAEGRATLAECQGSAVAGGRTSAAKIRTPKKSKVNTSAMDMDDAVLIPPPPPLMTPSMAGRKRKRRSSVQSITSTETLPTADSRDSPKAASRNQSKAKLNAHAKAEDEAFKMWTARTAVRIARTEVLAKNPIPADDTQAPKRRRGSGPIAKLPSTSIEVDEAAVATIEASLTSRSHEGVYINPPGAQQAWRENNTAVGKTGRPRKSCIAVVRSKRLGELEWFTAEEDGVEKESLIVVLETPKRSVPFTRMTGDNMDEELDVATEVPNSTKNDEVVMVAHPQEDSGVENRRHSNVPTLEGALQASTTPARIDKQVVELENSTRVGLQPVSPARSITAPPDQVNTLHHQQIPRGPISQGKDAPAVIPSSGLARARSISKLPPSIFRRQNTEETETAPVTTAEQRAAAKDLRILIAGRKVGKPTKAFCAERERLEELAGPARFLPDPDKKNKLLPAPLPRKKDVENVQSPACVARAAPTLQDDPEDEDYVMIDAENADIQQQDVAAHISTAIAGKHAKPGVRKDAGIVLFQRTKIIMDVMTLCHGVFPGNNEMWYPLASAWFKMYRQTPDRQTLERNLAQLIETGSLKRIEFSFTNKKGTVETRKILLLPDIDEDCAQVHAVRDTMMEMWPLQYIPDEAPVLQELRDKAASVPVAVGRQVSENLWVTPLGTTTQEVPKHYSRDEYPTVEGLVVRRTAEAVAFADQYAIQQGYAGEPGEKRSCRAVRKKWRRSDDVDDDDDNFSGAEPAGVEERRVSKRARNTPQVLRLSSFPSKTAMRATNKVGNSHHPSVRILELLPSQLAHTAYDVDWLQAAPAPTAKRYRSYKHAVSTESLVLPSQVAHTTFNPTWLQGVVGGNVVKYKPPRSSTDLTHPMVILMMAPGASLQATNGTFGTNGSLRKASWQAKAKERKTQVNGFEALDLQLKVAVEQSPAASPQAGASVPIAEAEGEDVSVASNEDNNVRERSWRFVHRSLDHQIVPDRLPREDDPDDQVLSDDDASDEWINLNDPEDIERDVEEAEALHLGSQSKKKYKVVPVTGPGGEALGYVTLNYMLAHPEMSFFHAGNGRYKRGTGLRPWRHPDWKKAQKEAQKELQQQSKLSGTVKAIKEKPPPKEPKRKYERMRYERAYVIAHPEERFYSNGHGMFLKGLRGSRYKVNEDRQDLAEEDDSQAGEGGLRRSSRSASMQSLRPRSSAGPISLAASQDISLPQVDGPPDMTIAGSSAATLSRPPTPQGAISFIHYHEMEQEIPVIDDEGSDYTPEVDTRRESSTKQGPTIAKPPKRQYKSRKRRLSVTDEANPANFGVVKKTRVGPYAGNKSLGAVDDRRLFVSLALVRLLCCGLTGKGIQWELVAHAMGFKYDTKLLRAMWAVRHFKDDSKVDTLLEYMREPFLVAYEEGVLPRIDFQSTWDTDWPALVQWAHDLTAKVELAHNTDEGFSAWQERVGEGTRLPASVEILMNEYDVTAPSLAWQLGADVYYENNGEAARESLASRYTYSMPLQGEKRPSDQKPDELLLLKSWCRAVVMTPDASYNEYTAARKIGMFPDADLKRANDELLESRIFAPEKVGRQLPGRNYHLASGVLRTLGRWPSPDHEYLRRVFAAREKIVAHIEEHGSLLMSFHVDDLDMLVLTNMTAHGQLKTSPVLPARDDRITAPFPRLSAIGYGNADNPVDTRSVPKSRLRFPILYERTDAFVTEHPLISVPIPLAPAVVRKERGSRIPLWVDINGKLLDSMWDVVVRSVLHLLVWRPGSTSYTMERAHGGKLWAWEIEMVVGWMQQVGLALPWSAGGGWRASEWWYCAFAPEVAVWGVPKI